MIRPIQILLVGVGGYGQKLAQRIQKIPSFRITTCYHPDLRKAKSASQLFNCFPTNKIEQAFFHENVDAVIIATPDPSHSHYVQQAIDAGIHIFVEKPMFAKWEEVTSLYNKLTNYSKIIFTGHNMRREPAFQRIKKEYDQGKLGELVTFQINLSHGGAFNWNQDYWRVNPELCREGPLRVNGVHASDVLEYLFGSIDTVYAKLKRKGKHKAPDTGIALVKVGNAWGSVSASWVVPSINHFQFQFTEAFINFDLETLQIRYGRDVNCVQTPTIKVKNEEYDSRTEQLLEFANCISENLQPKTGWQEGIRAVAFVESCYRSYLNNQLTQIQEVYNEIYEF